jgi:hypothetical protein
LQEIVSSFNWFTFMEYNGSFITVFRKVCYWTQCWTS